MNVPIAPHPGARATWTVGSAFTWASDRLASAGIETATLDARILLDRIAGTGQGTILAWRDRPLTPEQQDRFSDWIARRAGREPVARILGEKEFWSLPFLLGPDTLVPRPDSEILVETALGILSDRLAPASVLDLGTGSGCLLLAVLSERPGANGLGIDVSAGAVAIAEAKARRLGLADRARFRVGDWGSGVEQAFDIVLCNPPYIPSADIAGLEAEVARHDPQRALDGGTDGLMAIRAAGAAAARLLKPQGALVMEIGWDQEIAAAACLVELGLALEPVVTDLGGQPRCLIARRR